MFVNRENELKYLERLNQTEKAQFLIVYGRKRIGKTELLRYFSRDKEHLFFSSDLSSEREQLRQFSEKLYNTTSDAFLQNQDFSSWAALFQYLFDHLGDETRLVIIDEFPYLCQSNSALPSILQKVWDRNAGKKNIFLVICGSYMSFMEKEILSRKSPLYGRRTGQVFLKPFEFKEFSKVFKNYSREERVYVYAILGGTPAYLQKFDDRSAIGANVREQILHKNSYLYNEPHFLLMEELQKPATYFSILKALSHGKTRLNEIAQQVGLTSTAVNKYLTVLRKLHLVKREVPVTELKPHKSRKGLYFLEDNFFRFWFRYIYPNMSYLEENDIEHVWSRIIEPDLDTFVGIAFEDICIQRLKQLNRDNKLPFKADRIGRWWDGEDEIDIVAFNREGDFLFCECKWTRRKVGVSLFDSLLEKAVKFPQASTKYWGFFSKSGFTRELQSKADEGALLFEY